MLNIIFIKLIKKKLIYLIKRVQFNYDYCMDIYKFNTKKERENE